MQRNKCELFRQYLPPTYIEPDHWCAMQLAAAILLATGSAALRVPIQPRCVIKPRCPRPVACAAELPVLRKLRAKELKRRLEAAGISTVGVLEKEELVSLVVQHNLGGEAPTTSEASLVVHEASLVEQQGCAYAEVTTCSGATVRLLVDTGASRSVLASAAVERATGRPAVGQAQATIECPGLGGLALDCAVAPAGALPPGVDGIFGFDAMRQFRAVELDLPRGVMRLHASRYVADGSSPAVGLAMTVQRVSLGELPFVSLALHGGDGRCCSVSGLVDTGSPVTMATPELTAEAALPRAVGVDDIVTTGVDGRPTALSAVRFESAAMGRQEEPGGDRIVRMGGHAYSGTLPLMQQVGWAGRPAALIGLDLLGRRMVVDFEASKVWVD